MISASGNSPNLLRAVEHARAGGMTSIGFLGFDGGRLLRWSTRRSGSGRRPASTALVETMHSVACDIVTTCLIADRVTEPTSQS